MPDRLWLLIFASEQTLNPHPAGRDSVAPTVAMEIAYCHRQSLSGWRRLSAEPAVTAV
ncbi:MAG: hypothetical protein ONB06_10190 [candidate division KSB1 bacterium]|nr:hypothetical protein [candidate division KSB1 bacterium]